MNTRVMWGVIAFLFAVIIVLLYILIVTPAHAPTTVPVATTTPIRQATTTPTVDSNAPLHERVVVTTPKAGGTVLRQFEVAGEAPGSWYSEASFPIQIRDAQGNVIGRNHASAQGDWMTEGLVAFTTTITLDSDYSGPATLILLRDNPSGLPENEDSLEIPISIK